MAWASQSGRRRAASGWRALCAGVLLLCPLPLAAQEAVPEDPFGEFERPRSREDEISIEATLQARAEGREIVISGSGDRQFDAVLRAPDDAELNLRFARDSAAAGDLLSAAAAIERLLLEEPNWHAARLLYAVTLFRMEDVEAASRELDLLDGVELTPLQRAEVDKYRRLIARRDQRVSVSGSVNLGLAYDGNATGAIANLVDVGLGGGQKDDGLGFSGGGRLKLSARLADAEPTSVFLLASAQGRKDLSGPRFETLLADVSAGIAGEIGSRTAFTAAGLVRHLALFADPYLTEWGGRLAISRRLSHLTTVDASVEVTDQSFDEPLLAGLVPGLAADARSGVRVALAAGLSHRLSGATSLSAQLGWEDKSADFRPLAFSGPGFSGTLRHQLGRGAYSTLAGSVRVLDFKAPDPLLDGRERKETRSFVRAALGAPLSAFTDAGATADVREGMTLEAALSWTRRDTERPYLAYQSVGGELRLIWVFGE